MVTFLHHMPSGILTLNIDLYHSLQNIPAMGLNPPQGRARTHDLSISNTLAKALPRGHHKTKIVKLLFT